MSGIPENTCNNAESCIDFEIPRPIGSLRYLKRPM